MLSWFFEVYARQLRPEQIIYYEEIVASSGTVLQRIAPAAQSLNEPLESKNRNKLYDQVLLQTLYEQLHKTDGVIWDFYDKATMEDILVQ